MKRRIFVALDSVWESQLKRLKTVLKKNFHSSNPVPGGPQTKEKGKGRGVKKGERGGGDLESALVVRTELWLASTELLR